MASRGRRPIWSTSSRRPFLPSEPAAGPPGYGLVRSFGRRHGRRLRPERARLLATLLPRLAIAVPPPGPVAGAGIEPRALFAAAVDDVWLEVGFGAGEHLAGQASANPAIGLIGCEPYINGVAALLARIEADALANVRLFADDARLLLPALTEASLGRVFVLFADPWPKRRHHHRRFLSRPTLDVLARVLRDRGELVFASDSAAYVRTALAMMVHHPAFAWPAAGPSDWRVPAPDWIETRYEAKARRAGTPCYYLRFHRRSRECEK